jgi:hypothetical protein
MVYCTRGSSKRSVRGSWPFWRLWALNKVVSFPLLKRKSRQKFMLLLISALFGCMLIHCRYWPPWHGFINRCSVSLDTMSTTKCKQNHAAAQFMLFVSCPSSVPIRWQVVLHLQASFNTHPSTLALLTEQGILLQNYLCVQTSSPACVTVR